MGRQLAQTFVNGFKINERIIHTEVDYVNYMMEMVELYGSCTTTVFDL